MFIIRIVFVKVTCATFYVTFNREVNVILVYRVIMV